MRKLVFMLLAMTLWLGALTGVRTLPAIQLRWIAEEIKPEALKSALTQANKPIRASAWSTKVINGKTVAIYIGEPLLLTGDLMRRGSAEVCAVSEQFAISKWSSANVVGLLVIISGREYAVSGVYPAGVADVIIPWNGVSEEQFNQMAVQFPGQDFGAQYQKAVDFISMMGVNAPTEVLDAPLLYGISTAVAFLPGWMLVCLFIGYQWRTFRPYKAMRIPVCGLMIALGVGAMALVMRVPLTPPRWLLPSRWSEFSHWRMVAGDISARVSRFIRAAHNPLNSFDLSVCLRVATQGILSVLLFYDIRGGNPHAEKMDRALNHLRIMLRQCFGKRTTNAGGPGNHCGTTGSRADESFDI
ncbi:MAG: hypothetical protein VB099_15415 [Candidatus Limiplasma sp.]|nr:hypothetical protein [Candidatus Limiplasma sp.]